MVHFCHGYKDIVELWHSIPQGKDPYHHIWDLACVSISYGYQYHISDIKEYIKEKHESEYVSITQEKLDRKDISFVRETIYDKYELIN